MTHLALSDDLLDAQSLRALGAMSAGGADAGEVLVTAQACADGSLETWFAEWSALAARVRAAADTDLAAGRTTSARSGYLRATTYDRTAGLMLMGAPTDPRMREAYRRQRESFRAAARLLPHSVEEIAVPYEGTTLPGYFLRPAGDSRPRPTLILLNGYDGTCEELYFFNGAAAVARGYNAVMFDGPGQGAALLEQGLTLRHDWEAVVTPVVDFLVGRADVDPVAIALMGLSLGGYLAPRAAAYEHRLAACIADCGSYDMYAAALQRIPGLLSAGIDTRRAFADTPSSTSSTPSRRSRQQAGDCAAASRSTASTHRWPTWRRSRTSGSPAMRPRSRARPSSATPRATTSARPRRSCSTSSAATRSSSSSGPPTAPATTARSVRASCSGPRPSPGWTACSGGREERIACAHD